MPELESGISDSEVLSLAAQEYRILITGDKDFGELVYRQRQINSGVILLRIGGLTPPEKTDLVVSTIKKHVHEMGGFFSVLSPTALRIRKLESGIQKSK